MITAMADIMRMTSFLAAGEPRRARIIMPIWRPRPDEAASSAATFAAASSVSCSGLLVMPELSSTCLINPDSRTYHSTPGNEAGDECRVAPGQMPRGRLCARALVKLLGQFPIVG